jgi:carbon monoxide dehydrogenase subunit G
MATIYREIAIDADAAQVWEALRDFGAVERLVPGFVTHCEVEDGARVVTFFNGLVARELLVGLDERVRRVSYTSVGGRATHHQASAQVFGDGTGRSRLVWITDVLPDALAEPIASMMDRGADVMKRTLESRGSDSSGTR